MDLNALRKKKARRIIGLMSGTSCDGVDAALVRVEGSGREAKVTLEAFQSIPYEHGLRGRLLSNDMNAGEVCRLNVLVGEALVQASLEVMKAAEKKGKKTFGTVDFVASHGHTVAHFPPGEGAGPAGNQRTGESAGPAGTLQIGEAAVIAERTGLPVVSDFRPGDMAAGGQGAPLVPYADWVLFRELAGVQETGARDKGVKAAAAQVSGAKAAAAQMSGAKLTSVVGCLNIGGIANITVVTPELDGVFAFDTGPGNMVIDGTVAILSGGDLNMDEDGKAAAKGALIPKLLGKLLNHPYFDRPPPKSTGRETFGPEAYLRENLGPYRHHPFEDLVATVTAAVAVSIGRALRRFVMKRHALSHLIISGGGAFNPTLMAQITEGLPEVAVATSDAFGIPADAKEAVAFALLGNETVCGVPANVPTATGASHPVVLGKITPGVGKQN